MDGRTALIANFESCVNCTQGLDLTKCNENNCEWTTLLDVINSTVNLVDDLPLKLPLNPSNGYILTWVTADGMWEAMAPAYTGTVTSVGLSDGSTSPIYTITGSPVTGAGTLTFTLNTETANYIFAGPTSGAAAQPTFRVMVTADLPTALQNNSTTNTQSPGDASTKVATTAFVNANPGDQTLLMMQAIGSAVKAQSFDFLLCSSTWSLVNQRIFYMPVWLNKTQTITGICWYQQANGSYTPNNTNGAAVYSYSDGTLTQVATTGNVANIWQGGTGIRKQAFSGGAITMNGGQLYYIGFLLCYSAVSSSPVFAGLGEPFSAWVSDATNSAVLWGKVDGTTSIPGSQAMSGVSNWQIPMWVGLY